MTPFESSFESSISQGEASGHNSITVLIPKTVSSSAELIELLAAKLQFPHWHGKNWNALFDLLCDLSWLTERTITIVHEGLPGMHPEEYSEYLKVLNDAVASWQSNPGEHELIVTFPNGKTQSNASNARPEPTK